MKSMGTKLLMAAICVAVLAYFGLQGYRYLDAPYTTVLAYAYQEEESATVSGWASMTSIICFVSGVQLICLGVIGEYIGKIYMETKHRPRYIISETTPNFGDVKEDAQ